MNAHLRRTFYLFALGFVGLVGVLAYWQVYAREDLVNDPSNALQSRRVQESPRGLIFAGDGETVLARSEQAGEGNYERVYPEGPVFANVVGYWNQRYGASGIEIGQNNTLTGSGDPETLDELINQVSGGPQAGNNVTLTLDPELQRLAYEGIANSNTGRGAAVAFDPQTGETLALASYPSFDPNDIDEGFDELAQDPDAPLLNRATQALYPPGSTFKVITASAALEAGVRPDETFEDDGTFETPGYTVVNYRGREYGEVTFTESLVFSINTIFSKIAVERVGPEQLAEMAREYGFGFGYDDYPLPVAASDLGLPPSQWAPGNTAPISFGQDRVVSNAFEMALVASAIANDGEMMQPRLVREVRSPDGIILDRPTPRVLNEVIPAETANTLTGMMQEVITQGDLVEAQIQGVEVAGKTGTAEAPPGEPHSWFIAFAPAEDPEIAVAVMIENGGIIGENGEAATPAIPIAASMMRAYLDAPAEPPAPEPAPQSRPPVEQPPQQAPFQSPFRSPTQPPAGQPFQPTPQPPAGQQPAQPPAQRQQPIQPVQPVPQQPVPQQPVPQQPAPPGQPGQLPEQYPGG